MVLHHRLFSFFLLSLAAAPEALNAQIASIERKLYGSALIDSVPRNHFPRGGSYTAVIHGSGLAHVTGFVASDPNVSGSVTSPSDASVTVQISSTAVEDGDTANAPIPGVTFTLVTSSGSIPSGTVTFDIVLGPPPNVTSWVLTNTVKWIPAGVPATVKYRSTLVSSGNIQRFWTFWFGSTDVNIASWNIDCPTQFACTSDLTIVYTPQVNFSALSVGQSYAAVDGAGQGGKAPAPHSPSEWITLPVVQMQLVDPITGDSSTSLLSGSAISSNASLLLNSNYGTVVQGVAADGVTTLVVRVAGAPPNETFSFSSAQDGALAKPGNATSGSTLQIQADPSGNTAFLFSAPDDFARPNTMSSIGDPSRTVHLTFTSPDNDPNVIIGDTPINIVRPPVVLIHGFWGKPSNWDRFITNLHTLLGAELPFTHYLAWYNFQLPQMTAVQPALSPTALRAAQRLGDTSSLGFQFNAKRVLPELDVFINDFKSAKHVAAVQVDVIAHSMGGLVARAMPGLAGYYANVTLGAGRLHKLITIDSPHLGTPLASRLISTSSPFGDNTCFREYQAGRGKVAAVSVLADNQTIDGAVGDFVADGVGGGFLLPALPALRSGSPIIPTAFIAGNGCGYLVNSGGGFGDPCPFSPFATDIARFLDVCASTPLLTTLAATPNGSQFGWPSIFLAGPLSEYGGDSDGIVPLTSQLNQATSVIHNLPPLTYPVVHSRGANLLGFTAPNAFEDARVAAAAIQLLNTARSTPATFTKVF